MRVAALVLSVVWRPTLTPPDHVKSKGYRADQRPIYGPINTHAKPALGSQVREPPAGSAVSSGWSYLLFGLHGARVYPDCRRGIAI